MKNDTVILTTAYLPAIQYMAKIISYKNIVIEINETYSKQSYRNRSVILSCNGLLSLTIPVVKTNGNSTLTKDIRIDNSTNWQKNHWKAIESAYRNSAYYEFVADVLAPLYSAKEHFLIDFNRKLIEEILVFLGIRKQLAKSDDFVKYYPEDVDDFRTTIHPKSQLQAPDNDFLPVKYFQVFSDRFNFYPNLSVIDLLFNEGLDSVSVINSSIIKNLP